MLWGTSSLSAWSQQARDLKDAQQHLNGGLRLASQGSYQAAQLEFERADILAPNSFAILFNLGQAELKNHQTNLAIQSFTRALHLKPDSVESLLFLAQADTAEQKPLDALVALAKARDFSPANPEILYRMGEISFEQRYYEDAIPVLEQAAKLAPGRNDIATLLGETYFKAGRTNQAVGLLNLVKHKHDSLIVDTYLGFAYTQLGRFDDARRSFERGLAQSSSSAICMFHLGYLAKLQGNIKQAESLYARVLRSHPDDENSLFELAGIRLEQKRYGDAVVLLRRYVGISREPAAGYYKLALAERQAGDFPAAKQDMQMFQQTSSETTPSSRPYDHIFEYAESRSKLSSAERVHEDIATLEQQQRIEPDQWEIQYRLLEAYLSARDLTDASATIASIDKNHANDSLILTAVGVVLADHGIYQQAAAHLEAALKINADNDSTRLELASIYTRTGQYTDALHMVQAIPSQRQQDKEALMLLAKIELHLGNTSQAEDLYRRVLQANPDNEHIYVALVLLYLQEGRSADAATLLAQGQARIPGSAILLWTQGLQEALHGETANAATTFERVVDLLPDWAGSYSTLGFFYYETGQLTKAQEILDRFKNSSTQGGLNVQRIQEVLRQSPPAALDTTSPLNAAQEKQLLGLAAYIADKTL